MFQKNESCQLLKKLVYKHRKLWFELRFDMYRRELSVALHRIAGVRYRMSFSIFNPTNISILTLGGIVISNHALSN